MAENLFECTKCKLLFAVQMDVCPRCGAEKERRVETTDSGAEMIDYTLTKKLASRGVPAGVALTLARKDLRAGDSQAEDVVKHLLLKSGEIGGLLETFLAEPNFSASKLMETLYGNRKADIEFRYML